VLIVALAAAALGGGTSSASPAAGCSNSKVKAVAFFGFAAANSFAQATWKGVQQAAKACGASTKFFDPNFVSQTQVSQIQDAITSGQYGRRSRRGSPSSASSPPSARTTRPSSRRCRG
jgi:ribose transport system substrate-binding protein